MQKPGRDGIKPAQEVYGLIGSRVNRHYIKSEHYDTGLTCRNASMCKSSLEFHTVWQVYHEGATQLSMWCGK